MIQSEKVWPNKIIYQRKESLAHIKLIHGYPITMVVSTLTLMHPSCFSDNSKTSLSVGSINFVTKAILA